MARSRLFSRCGHVALASAFLLIACSAPDDDESSQEIPVLPKHVSAGSAGASGAGTGGKNLGEGGSTIAGEGGSDPGEGGSDPGEGGSDPGGGGSDPGEGGSDPGEGGSDPGEGGSDPGEGGSDPGEGGSDPGEGGSDPGEGGSDPGAGGSTAAGAGGNTTAGKGGSTTAGAGGSSPEEPPPEVTVGKLSETKLFDIVGTSNSYTALQGGGSDGTNGYFIVLWKKAGDIHVTQLLKYEISSGKRTLVVSFDAPNNKTNLLGHGNDATFNPDIKKLIVPAWTNDQSTQPTDNQKLLRIIDPATLKIVETKTLDVNVTNLCYANKTYLTFSGGKFRTYDANFKLKSAIAFDIKEVEDQYAPSGERVGQGIDCDDDYVYITRWYPQANSNRVYVANWKAQLVGAYTYDGPESETLIHASGHRILHTINTAGPGGDARRIDNLQFVVQFIAEGGTGSMANLRVLFGRNTPLRKNTFVRSGKTFTGWAAERASDNKWRYQKPDKSSDGWYAKGSQPSGWGYYIYKDQAIVLKSAPYGLVKMHAQWK